MSSFHLYCRSHPHHGIITAPIDAIPIFQGVHMLMGISSSADGIGRGWGEGEARRNRLVFIGRNLVREEIMANFKACVVSTK